ncbi:MAG TPA: CAP domain-containing protein [Rubrobacter sp.]|nr:CAP domain-containing protein [Rubrobacter sp.]
METWKTLGSGTGGTRRRWLMAVVVLILLSTFALAGSGGAATAYDAEELEFLGLINEYRGENGLRPVILSDTLAVAAERHSKDMAEYGFFAHDTAQSSYYAAGSELWDRMEAEGYDHNTAKGENLAVGYETAEEAMQAWKESPSHNAAMLDGNYRVMGVARINAPGSVHGWYWTTDFGGYVDASAHAPGETPSGQRPQQPAAGAPAKPPTTDEAPGRGAGEPKLDTRALDNGDLGRVGGWSQRARDGADLILDGHARLGGYHDGNDELRQKIRIGAGATLAYDVRVKAGSEDPDDTMLLRLTNGKGKQVALLKRYTGGVAGGWQRERVDLSRFAGQTLYLDFDARTDGGRLTTFYLDRLALRP